MKTLTGTSVHDMQFRDTPSVLAQSVAIAHAAEIKSLWIRKPDWNLGLRADYTIFLSDRVATRMQFYHWARIGTQATSRLVPRAGIQAADAVGVRALYTTPSLDNLTWQ